MITNSRSGTRVDEIAGGIYRISTPVTENVPGGFSFNQYLVVDDAPLLFHSGPRGMFPLVRDAISAVMPVERLHYVGFSHFENDECGALNLLLAAAPEAVPVCGRINALINGDAFDRTAHALDDGESLVLGNRTVHWIDTPHLPHAWIAVVMDPSGVRAILEPRGLPAEPPARSPARPPPQPVFDFPDGA
jgi:glyoxylase-like metal-dependent hydrolase (beta-lactamase superfamily II)